MELLRTLTKKSRFKHGPHKGTLVSVILSNSPHKLVSAYYFLEKISFNEEILTELGIPQEFRIEKPGVGKQMRKDFYKWKLEQMPKEVKEAITKKYRKEQIASNLGKTVKTYQEFSYSKSALRNMNRRTNT